jgi:zinc protease
MASVSAVAVLLMTRCGKKENAVFTRLDDGIDVVFKTMPRSDVATVLLLAGAGPAYETESNRGISRLLEHCLFRATAELPDVRKTIDSLGGAFASNVDQDFVSFSVTVEKSHLLEMIRVVAGVVDSSKIDGVLVQSVKAGLLKTMEGEDENPRVTAINLFLHSAFPEGPYRFLPLGKAGTVRTLNAEDVVRFYRSRFVPGSVALVVTGDFDGQAVLDALRGRFPSFRLRTGPEPASKNMDRPEKNPDRNPEPREIRGTFNFPPNIAMVTVGWEAPSIQNPDTYGVDVLVACLGTGQASRLNTQIRGGMDSVYSIWAEYVTPRKPGYLMIAGICHPLAVGRLRDRILKEVDILKKDLITPDELVRAKAALKSIKAYADQSTNGAAMYLGYGTIQGSSDFTVHYDKNIDAVTSEEVRRAAVQYLKNDGYTTVILLPAGKRTGPVERRRVP